MARMRRLKKIAYTELLKTTYFKIFYFFDTTYKECPAAKQTSFKKEKSPFLLEII